MTRRQNPETRLQFVVVAYLRAVLPRDALFWHCPNGGKMSAAWRKMLGGLGVLPGASDLMLVYRGRFYGIELKTALDPVRGITKGYQSEAQRAFQDAVERAGGHYAVCRHTDDVRDALALWGVPTREKRPAVASAEAVA